MARQKQKRVIQQPPKVKGFNPMGVYTSKTEAIQLNLEEYESIRLIDYENLSQEQASVYMKVSRPTLTRIYDAARKKLGRAIIKGLQIQIEGGKFIFNEPWFECSDCECKFNNPDNTELNKCIMCSSINVNPIFQHP